MKILTDLGHPKNVHVLKNLVPRLATMGHELHCVYREREHVKDLCNAFALPAVSRGAGASGIFGKFIYLIKTDWQLLKLARKIKPDLLLSFASPYLANLALLTGIPMIVFDDTEQNWLVQKIYSFCSAAIVVPVCFGKALSKCQFNFDGYYELAYLSPNCFQPENSILHDLGLEFGEKYVLLRFVAWQAVHDFRHRGLSPEEKQELVAQFSGLARVFISAEGGLPDELEPLRLKTPPEMIHKVMANASLVFSEGATMAAEAAVLGVPTVYCSDLRPGYITDLEKRYGLLNAFPRNGFKGALAKGMDILADRGEYRKNLEHRRDAMLADCVDVIAFMTWFVDKFPKSVETMLADPQYGRKK